MHSGDQHFPSETSEPPGACRALAADLLEIHSKNQKSNIPSTVALEPLSPKGMLFLARDPTKEVTSVEPPSVRSGESWGS